MRRDGFVVVVAVRCCVRWSVRDVRPALETYVLDAIDSKATSVTESPKFRSSETANASANQTQRKKTMEERGIRRMGEKTEFSKAND
jgi:hypothetical protein